MGGPRRPESHPSTPNGGSLDHHRLALRSVAVSLCHNTAECDDLVQETFTRALDYLERRPENVRNERAWLVRILRNVFIDRIRTDHITTPEVEDFPAAEPEPPPPWAEVTVDDVRAALAAIDPDLRDVFERHHLEGLRYREIAARLGIPENTVASRLFRARKALRDHLLASSSEEAQGEEHLRTER